MSEERLENFMLKPIQKESYSPRTKNTKILDRAYELINSVPYKVSARWVFYKLFQEGYYTKKDDYKNSFNSAISKARHAFYKGWRPDILVDDTRDPVVRGDGSDSPESWFELVKDNLSCKLDKWQGQPVYLELWYEARAMTDQFRYYTEHVTLRPMGGQPSIPYKWQASKELENAAVRYRKPLVVLYFGDLDNAGEKISETVERDVRKWCRVDFEFVHCGLTDEQVDLYKVPENFEKPGQYQWEALTDKAAREIITNAKDKYLRLDVFSQAEDREEKVTAWMRVQMKDVFDRWEG